MKEKLIKLLDNAYTPYYKFPVSCIVLTKDNKEFYGVNVENSNGTSVCAERNAIHSAVCAGYKKGDFKSIYIMAEKENNIVPCFACRQVILEFFEEDDLVISVSKDGTEVKYLVKDLCPYAFTGSDLR